MTTVTGTSVFWDDLARDLEDPDFHPEFAAESMRIATLDEVVTAVDDISRGDG